MGEVPLYTVQIMELSSIFHEMELYLLVDRLRAGRGTTRAKYAQGTPNQSHTAPS